MSNDKIMAMFNEKSQLERHAIRNRTAFRFAVNACYFDEETWSSPLRAEAKN